jgi:hypothetical protein
LEALLEKVGQDGDLMHLFSDERPLEELM